MAKGKIDKLKLSQMLRAGKPQSEIAQVFQCSPGAISKMKKQLSISVARTVALETAHVVAQDGLNAVSQLEKINRAANMILDQLMDKIRKEKGTSERRKLKEVALKSMAEIRNQLSLELEIMKTLYDVAEISGFQREVLGVIGGANESSCCKAEVVCAKCGQKIDLRSLIIQRLKEARALRSGAKLKP